MKKSFILMSLVLGALALTSCNNSDIESINTDKGTFSFTVSTDTRATIEGYSVSWENGDIIALGAAQAGDVSVAAKEFVWKNSNTFTADTTYDSAKTYDFYAIYPAAAKKGQCFTTENTEKPNAYSMYLNVGAKELSQNGSSMDHVMKYAPMYGTSKNTSPDNLNISMHHAAALLDFAITNGTEDAITIKSFKMETPATDKFCGTYYVSYDGTLKPSGDKYVYNECQVNVIDGTSLASKSGEFHIYMPIAPVTLANGAAVKFTITTTDDKVCVINKTLKKEVVFGAGTISAQTLLFESAGSITYNTISEITAAGDYNVKDAVVLAVAGSNVILGDGTGNILAFKSGSGLTAGQIVTIAGTIKAYNGVWEFDTPTFTVTGTLDPFSRGTAIAYDEAAIAAYESSPIVDYVTVSGTLSDAHTLTIGSHVFYTYTAAGVSLTSFVGKNVECEGYVFGNNASSHKTSYAITSIKETSGTTPSITLPSTSAAFEASESGSAVKKSIDFTAENTNVTITCSAADWLEFSANNSTKHFEFYPKSANTGSARTATVTIAASAGSQYNKTFTITQNGVGAVEKVMILDGTPFLTSYTTADSLVVFKNGMTINVSKGAKYQAVQKGAENYFAKDSAIIIGKTGSYIYNTTPVPGRITKFEVYANKGASAKVTVGVMFSDTPISKYEEGSNTYTVALSTVDKVYDCSSKLSANAKYFWYQVTNEYNSQVQFRITYVE